MFTYPNPEERVRPKLVTGKGMTKQAHKSEADINNIMSKYQKTGMISFASRVAPEFMEVQPIDLQEAMNLVIRSNEMFAEMPSSMRKKFENDPMKFLDFVNNPENIEEMYDLGLATRPETPTPPQPAPEPEPEPTPA